VRFRSALERGPENPGTLYNLGLSLEALGRTDEARAALERSSALDPGGPAAAHLGRAQPR
jgi:Flp pilus assembly protein TadD